MKHDAKRVGKAEETTRFYLIFSELAKVCDEQDATSDEINEIEQVVRMVTDVNDEPPQFVTST